MTPAHTRAGRFTLDLYPEDICWWGQDVLGLPVRDNWWQTGTGGIMSANYPAMDIRPGSMAPAGVAVPLKGKP